MTTPQEQFFSEEMIESFMRLKALAYPKNELTNAEIELLIKFQVDMLY